MKRWINCFQSHCALIRWTLLFAVGCICIKSMLHNEEEAIKAKLLKKNNKQRLKDQVKIDCCQEMFLSSCMQTEKEGCSKRLQWNKKLSESKMESYLPHRQSNRGVNNESTSEILPIISIGKSLCLKRLTGTITAMTPKQWERKSPKQKQKQNTTTSA